MLGTIDHAGQVLALFTAERPEWGVSEVSRALGLSKTRSHALLSSLAHIGLLHRMQTGRYRLGFRVLAMSRVLLGHTPWREVAQAEMRVLASRVGGRVGLAAFDGLELVTVAEVPEGGPRAKVPPHSTAAGQVMLAYRPPRTVRAVLDLHRQEEGTVTSLPPQEDLAATLKAVRQQGYAALLNWAEGRAQTGSVAAPIRNHTGEVIAALSVTAAALPFDQDRAALQREVLSSAALVSGRIGYDGPDSSSRHLTKYSE